MIVTKYQLEEATREAAKDRAHEMCIDKIKQLSEENETLKGQPHMKKVYDLEQENDHLRLNLKEAYSVGRARDKQNSKLLDDKIKLDGKLDELYGDIQQLVIDNVELTERNNHLAGELGAALAEIKVANGDFNDERLSLRAENKRLIEHVKAANRRIEELTGALKDWQIHLEGKS